MHAMVLCAQYNSYSTHYREVDCMREMLEPFLYNAGVDIILHGPHTPPCQTPLHDATHATSAGQQARRCI